MPDHKLKKQGSLGAPLAEGGLTQATLHEVMNFDLMREEFVDTIKQMTENQNVGEFIVYQNFAQVKANIDGHSQSSSKNLSVLDRLDMSQRG